MGNDAFLLKGTIGVDATPLQRGLMQAQGTLQQFAAQAGPIGNMIAGGFTVAAVAGVAAYTVELGKAGAQSLRLENSFRGLAKSPDALVARLKEASGETIATSNLMLESNRAVMLGLGSDVQTMGQLMEVARFKGRAMGLTTAEAYGDMVTGLGRLSPEILDNLGIAANANKTYADYSASIGKTADQLSEVEKKQALTNRVISEGQAQIAAAGGLADDAADKFERYGAKVEDLKESISKLAVEPATVIVDFAIQGVDVVQAAIDAIEARSPIKLEFATPREADEELRRTAGRVSPMAEEWMSRHTDLASQWATGIAMYGKAWNQMTADELMDAKMLQADEEERLRAKLAYLTEINNAAQMNGAQERHDEEMAAANVALAREQRLRFQESEMAYNNANRDMIAEAQSGTLEAARIITSALDATDGDVKQLTASWEGMAIAASIAAHTAAYALGGTDTALEHTLKLQTDSTQAWYDWANNIEAIKLRTAMAGIPNRDQYSNATGFSAAAQAEAKAYLIKAEAERIKAAEDAAQKWTDNNKRIADDFYQKMEGAIGKVSGKFSDQFGPNASGTVSDATRIARVNAGLPDIEGVDEPLRKVAGAIRGGPNDAQWAKAVALTGAAGTPEQMKAMMMTYYDLASQYGPGMYPEAYNIPLARERAATGLEAEEANKKLFESLGLDIVPARPEEKDTLSKLDQYFGRTLADNDKQLDKLIDIGSYTSDARDKVSGLFAQPLPVTVSGGDGGGGSGGGNKIGSGGGWGDYGQTITGEPRSRLYASGGVVEGSPGRPVPIIAHGGEWIFNQLQQEQLKAILAGGRGDTYITGPLTVRTDKLSGIMQEIEAIMPTSL